MRTVFSPKRLTFCLILLVLSLAISGCNYASIFVFSAGIPAAPQQLVPKIISVRPHDTASFTEGLALYNGFLYESSGLYGKSNLRKVDPQTGKVVQRLDNSQQVFAEGLTELDNRLVQLTWHENIAYIYDVNTFAQLGTFSYTGEGWGLCFDGQQFYMTDGSAYIYSRDAKTFAVTGKIQIMQDGKPITMLNELECVGDSLYSNVWMTNNILRIDKATGRITAMIDASGLLTPQEITAAGPDGVLNGIAYDPSHDTFLITGKLWPKLFEVQFVEKSGAK